MPTVSNLFFISALLCIVQLCALCPLLRSEIPGVKDWCLGNIFAFAAFILYALGKELPPLIAYEAANGMYALATAAILAGFLRFFGKEVPWLALGCGVALLTGVIALFHYAYDSFALRTIAVSAYQVVLQSLIALTILKSRTGWLRPYSHWFTTFMAGAVAIGNAARAVVYLTNQGEMTSLLQPSFWNLVFLTFGAMVLPILTIGAVMMVQERMLAKAEYAANRDFLTGAWSRRAFFEIAEREIQLVNRHQSPLSLLLLDVDHFKIINDRLGHAVGDDVLVDVVLQAENTIRTTDYFARIGGEEFAVLLPDSDMDGALGSAERLRTALDRNHSAKEIDEGKMLPAYTVSIGVAELQNGETFSGLLHRADTALYKAKQSGRNSVAASTGHHGFLPLQASRR